MKFSRGYGRWVGVLVVSWLTTLAYAQSVGPINTARLRTLDQKPVTLSDFSQKLLAVVFLSPDCPLCQQYTRTLNQLQAQYPGEVAVIGIFPGKAYTLADYQQFKSTYGIGFTLLTDRPRQLNKALAATITPEVFLLDAQRNVLYAGAIDDWVVALGKTRNRPGKLYLADAITAHTSGQPIPLARTKALGCFINDY